ncbi:MAG: hypothetical protein M1824_003222 [Vezdaea acicularis]|nr:MAG: hypothetical protein M1824_003222 [Vezdaea acicularis]
MPRPCTQEFPRNFGVIDSSLSWTSHNVARPRGKSLPSLLDAQQNTVDNEPSQTSQCEITGLSKRSPLAKSQSLLFSPWLNTSSVPTEGLLTPRQSDLINLSRLKAGQIGLGSSKFKGRNDTQHKEPLEITTRCLLTPVGPPIPRTSMLPRSKTMGSLLLPQQTRDPGSKSSFGYRDRGTPEIPQPEPERHRKPAGIDKSKRRSTTFFSPKPLPVFTTNPRQIKGYQHGSYWAGRFVALYDRFRTEDMNNPDGSVRDKAVVPALYGGPKMTADEKRIKRAFIHLRSLCLNEGAKKSLEQFQFEWAVKNDYPSVIPQSYAKKLDIKNETTWEKVKRLGRRKSSMESTKSTKSSKSLKRLSEISNSAESSEKP